ncbi:MAG: asparagine synthase (glutamine-hydrolyzing), partial [Akkermansiaceae bacterium]|nr:asparagine synthase (glutamine-hydrolyzing) [Akkermansiaceae bacterium]
MCGIFGYAGEAPEGCVARMGAALRHRGPDGEGSFTAAPFAAGMTRLAILDPDGGRQPFRSEDGRIQVVCNGEIYNWRELRAELQAAGHAFHTGCDCEVLPHAWEEWGPGMFPRLNGMFALALHDAHQERFILARDRYGQKPLYHARHGEALMFASEIRALAAAGLPPQFAPHHLRSYLTLRYVPEPETLFDGIRILPAGHWMELRAGDPAAGIVHRWHEDAPPVPFSGTPDEAVEELDALLRAAIPRALQSDVPVAVYLSGGVDSSLLAEAIRETGAAPRTFSLALPGPADESAAAEEWARELEFPFTRVECGPDALLDLPRVVAQMEVPVGDALIVAFDRLAAAASSVGCKVALGGEGADELFGGYSFQRLLRTAGRLGALGRPAAAAALQVLPAGALDRLSPFPAGLGSSGRRKVVEYLRGFGRATPWWRGVALRTLFTP